MRNAVFGAAILLALAGCGDDTTMGDTGVDTGTSDSGADTGTGDVGTDTGTMDGGGDSSTGDAGDGGGDAGDGGDGGDADAGIDLVARGNYLANHVWTCNDCHTPRDPKTQAYIPGMRFAGVEDLLGMTDIDVPNITPHMTAGIGAWTDAEIRASLVDGMDRDGNIQHPIMPYWVLTLLTDQDIDAIIAYLRTVPAVDNTIPPMAAFPVAVVSLVPDDMPMPTLEATDPLYETAMAGRYLATPCLDCHSPELMAAGEPPVDLANAFGGGKSFMIAPSVEVWTTNITQGTNGSSLTDIDMIKNALLSATPATICPPMPIGPDGYGGLTEEDATAIATYIFYLPHQDVATAYPMCPLRTP